MMREMMGKGMKGKAMRRCTCAATALIVTACAATVYAAPEPVTLTTRMNNRQEWNEETGGYLSEFAYAEIRLGENDAAKYPGLAAALEELNRTAGAELEEYYEMQLAAAKEQLGENPEFFMPYTDKRAYLVQRADAAVVSFLETRENYSGGVHGSYGYASHNYDPSTGGLLSLSDVVTDEAGVKALLRTSLKAKYPEMDWSYEREMLEGDSFSAAPGESSEAATDSVAAPGESSEAATDSVAVPGESSEAATDSVAALGESSEAATDSVAAPGESDEMEAAFDPWVWTAGYNGLTFWFGNYAIGSYAEGLQNVTIPYAGNEAMFNEKYTDVPENYAYAVPKWETFSADVDGDGTLDSLSFFGNRMDEYSYDSISVLVNGDTTTAESWFYDYEGSLVRKDGATYLYIFAVSDNDYRLLDVFDLSEGKAVHVKQEDMGPHMVKLPDSEKWAEEQFVSPEDFSLDIRTDLISTVGAYRRYTVGKDGRPEPLEDAYTFSQGRVITTKEELEAVSVKDGEEKAITLPKGTELTLDKTDNKTYADTKTGAGETVRLYVDGSDWPRRMNGKDIYDLFDGILFAG